MNGDIAKRFGARIRELREQQGLSQESLAERAGLDRTYVSGVERGVRNPTLSTIHRLAAGLSLPVVTLFKGVADKP
jgi:transcriptional regulator with XRE-family HTH domain